MDSPNDTRPLKEIKQMLNLEKDSSKIDSGNTSSHTFTPTPNVRKGFRRKKGDSPFTYNLNLKVKKEKKQILIHGLELLEVEIQQPYIWMV